MTLLADAVRLRDLGERKGLRDREREAPGLDQLADLVAARSTLTGEHLAAYVGA